MTDNNTTTKDGAATPVHPKTTEMPRPQSRVLQDMHSYRIADSGIRKSLIKSLYPRYAFPTLRQEEADALAAEFDLSGAQIDNVAVKWDLAEPFLQERDFRFLRRLCREESGTGKAGRGGNKIGF